MSFLIAGSTAGMDRILSRSESSGLSFFIAACKPVIQDSLASLGAGFGSAKQTKYESESLRILAERISDGELTPATDIYFLLAA